jgi:hypothetical protein
MKISGKNQNFRRKSKFQEKIKISGKNQNFRRKSKFQEKKSKFQKKNENFGNLLGSKPEDSREVGSILLGWDVRKTFFKKIVC